MKQNINIKTLNYNEVRTYGVAFIFIIGNIALPQFCHLFPQGGLIWLPIYFFTLIASYKYGWKVGLLTALCSPIVNNLLFSMPTSGLLPAILIKSVSLSLIAAAIAHKTNRLSLSLLTLVVVAYQTLGTLAEWLLCGSLDMAMQDFRIGIPGMILQVVGGYLCLKTLNNQLSE